MHHAPCTFLLFLLYLYITPPPSVLCIYLLADSWLLDLLHHYIHQCLGCVTIWSTEVLTRVSLFCSVLHLALSIVLLLALCWHFANKHMDGWILLLHADLCKWHPVVDTGLHFSCSDQSNEYSLSQWEIWLLLRCWCSPWPTSQTRHQSRAAGSNLSFLCRHIQRHRPSPDHTGQQEKSTYLLTSQCDFDKLRPWPGCHFSTKLEGHASWCNIFQVSK